MNQLISNVKNIPGVVGVAVFKDTGSLVAYDFPEAYDKNLLSRMGLKFQPIKEILPQEEREIVYLCWEYEDLLAFYYPVGGGWIIIISSTAIPMPVFSLTMTAVSSKLPGLLEAAGSETAPEPGQPVSTPAAAPAPAAAGHTVPPGKIAELEKLFALYLGPASAVIFKRTAHHLGLELDNFPGERLPALIDGVMAKVTDNKKEEITRKLSELSFDSE